jgi:thioredoxin-like negative regulator of GroEL
MKKVLRFTASWCQPCKGLAMNLASVETEVPIEIIDIDYDPDTTTKYMVRGVPTLVMLEDDKEIRRVSGMKSTKELQEWINN